MQKFSIVALVQRCRREGDKFLFPWNLSLIGSPYFANMTSLSSYNWRSWVDEKFRLSQVRTKLQKQKIGAHEIFKLFADAKLFFFSANRA